MPTEDEMVATLMLLGWHDFGLHLLERALRADDIINAPHEYQSYSTPLVELPGGKGVFRGIYNMNAWGVAAAYAFEVACLVTQA